MAHTARTPQWSLTFIFWPPTTGLGKEQGRALGTGPQPGWQEGTKLWQGLWAVHHRMVAQSPGLSWVCHPVSRRTSSPPYLCNLRSTLTHSSPGQQEGGVMTLVMRATDLDCPSC